MWGNVMNFRAQAFEHQARFRESLGIGEYNRIPAILNEKDARLGRNFYAAFPGLFEQVQRRFPFDRHKMMYAHMVRSEHIPFNFFVPLILDKSNDFAGKIFKKLLGPESIGTIESIEIESAPKPKDAYLDDNTAFDVFLSARNDDGAAAGIGVEVKYTEKSYPYGDLERKRMFDPNDKSPYHRVTGESGLFIPGAITKLREIKLKQTWRNHLLGEAMKLKGDVSSFYSVLLYPSGNSYQSEVCNEYCSLLRPEKVGSFRGVTFEEFIRVGRDVCGNSVHYVNWLGFLADRYIVERP